MIKRLKSLFLILLILFSPLVVSAEKTTEKTLKIGYIDYYGFISQDQNGNFTGYGVDYFNEISKYTNWKYEYVKINETDADKMLEQEQVDVMCGATTSIQNRDETEFSLYPIGVEQFALYTLPTADLFADDFETFNKKAIGVLSVSSNVKALKSYAQRNGFEYNSKEYKTNQELTNALITGEVDAIATVDLSLGKQLKIIAKYASNPVYAITKLRDKTLEEINRALSIIKIDKPSFDGELYKKHYAKAPYNTAAIYTRQEIEYIKNAGVFKVGCWDDRIPISFIGEDSEKVVGINIDLMEEISKISGIKFEYIPIPSETPLRTALSKGEIDIACGLPGIREDSYQEDVKTSTSFMRNRMIFIAKNREITLESDLTVAISKTALSIIEYVKENYPQYKILEVDSLYQTFVAVVNGKADITLCNEYVATYYIQKPFFSKLLVNKSKFVDEPSVLMWSAEQDPLLLSIINKAIMSISADTTDGIITAYVAATNYKMTLSDILYQNGFAIIVAALIIIAVLMVVNKMTSDRKATDKKIRAINQELVLNQRIYDTVLEQTKDIIFEWEFATGMVKYSKDIEMVLNRNQITTGFPYSQEILDQLHPDDIDEYKKTYDIYFNGGKNSKGEYRFKNTQGGYSWFKTQSTAICDENGNIITVVGMLSDVNNEKHQLLQAVNQAQKDTLTDIYNRKAAQEVINTYLKQEKQGAMLILDIDNFKGVNDDYGHQTGDEVLIKIAKELKQLFRKNDVVSRLGGDEFLVFMEDVSSVDVVTKKAMDIINTFKNVVSEYNHKIKISVSIGISIYPKDGKTFETLYRKADQALYVAKNNGKNTFVIYR